MPPLLPKSDDGEGNGEPAKKLGVSIRDACLFPCCVEVGVLSVLLAALLALRFSNDPAPANLIRNGVLCLFRTLLSVRSVDDGGAIVPANAEDGVSVNDGVILIFTVPGVLFS